MGTLPASSVKNSEIAQESCISQSHVIGLMRSSFKSNYDCWKVIASAATSLS